MRKFLVAALLLGSSVANGAFVQPAMAAEAAAGYSVEATEIGTLLDDPAAKAILEKHLPEFMASGRTEAARGFTLKTLAQYRPEIFTEKALADIQAELAKLPPKS